MPRSPSAEHPSVVHPLFDARPGPTRHTFYCKTEESQKKQFSKHNFISLPKKYVTGAFSMFDVDVMKWSEINMCNAVLVKFFQPKELTG